jgi:phosphoglucosamine mutase
MKRRYFGTDGVRGGYGGDLINESFVARLVAAAVRWSASHRGQGTKPTVLIGRDTRSSGVSLETAVIDGVLAAGGTPLPLGVLPTPAVARAVKEQQADFGVVITASHNPAGDNGIKFFGPQGLKLNDADELAIESFLPDVVASCEVQPGYSENAVQSYITKAGQLLAANSLVGWRIVLDTANGATCGTSPVVLAGFGAEVLRLGAAPNGQNINAGVGSEYPAKLSAAVIESGARLGIAHDGDGDRCVLCDEHGEILDGDEILTILALDALERDTLVANTLVITVQSNLGVDAAVAACGGLVLRTNVGDRYVIERMRLVGAMLGGESSGHIVCADVSPTGDGLVAALRVIEVMQRSGKPLSVLRLGLRKFPQRTTALRVSEQRELAACAKLQSAITLLETQLGVQGRVLVRYSGTEAKLRLLVEGPTPEITEQGLAMLEQAARADLHVL